LGEVFLWRGLFSGITLTRVSHTLSSLMTNFLVIDEVGIFFKPSFVLQADAQNQNFLLSALIEALEAV